MPTYKSIGKNRLIRCSIHLLSTKRCDLPKSKQYYHCRYGTPQQAINHIPMNLLGKKLDDWFGIIKHQITATFSVYQARRSQISNTVTLSKKINWHWKYNFSFLHTFLDLRSSSNININSAWSIYSLVQNCWAKSDQSRLDGEGLKSELILQKGTFYIGYSHAWKLKYFMVYVLFSFN